MWSTPESTEALTARATAAFARHLLTYCHDTFGRNLTNEELAVHISQQMGVEVPREALKQYRNGRRFRLFFYQMLALMMRVPLSDFIYEEDDAQLDRLHGTQRDFRLLYDLESGKPAMAVGHDYQFAKTITDDMKVLQISAKNNGAEHIYKTGQLLLVDTNINEYTFAGVYAVRKDGTVIVTELDSAPPEGQTVVGKITSTL